MSGTVILLLISMYRCSLNLSPNTPAHQPKFVQDVCVCVFARISKVQLHVRDVINKTAQSANLSRREKQNRSNIHLICAGLRAYNWQPQQQLTTNSLKHCTTLSCLLYLSISRSFSPLHTQSDFLQIDGTSIQGREKKKNNVGCVYNIYRQMQCGKTEKINNILMRWKLFNISWLMICLYKIWSKWVLLLLLLFIVDELQKQQPQMLCKTYSVHGTWLNILDIIENRVWFVVEIDFAPITVQTAARPTNMNRTTNQKKKPQISTAAALSKAKVYTSLL